MRQEWFKGIDEYLEDPAASDWFKMVLNSALQRDPVDALNDTEMLVTILHSELYKHLKKDEFTPPKFLEYGTQRKFCPRCATHQNEYGFCRCVPLDDELP